MNKENIILTAEETEQLCRLYLDCMLTIQEETELRYILPELPYDTPVISEARKTMEAEGLLSGTNIVMKPQSSRKRIFRFADIAASVAITAGAWLMFSMGNGADFLKYAQGYKQADKPEIAIAYSGGEMLDASASEKAVILSQNKAEALLAMAEAMEREAQLQQQYIIDKTNL